MSVTDPVEIQRIALAAFTAGMVVLFGACYAILLALSKLRRDNTLQQLSSLSYLALAASVLALGWLLRFDGIWLVLIAVLLVGYYIAPRFIWRLSVATHDSEEDQEGENHD